jgi:hypothetical protein
MRIAILSEAFAPSLGGHERSTAELARWLSVPGHEVMGCSQMIAGSSRR